MDQERPTGQKPRLQRAAHAGATLRMWQLQCLERRPEHAPSSACPRAPAPVPLARDGTPREPQAPRSHSLILTALEPLLCPGGGSNWQLGPAALASARRATAAPRPGMGRAFSTAHKHPWKRDTFLLLLLRRRRGNGLRLRSRAAGCPAEAESKLEPSAQKSTGGS